MFGLSFFSAKLLKSALREEQIEMEKDGKRDINRKGKSQIGSGVRERNRERDRERERERERV